MSSPPVAPFLYVGTDARWVDALADLGARVDHEADPERVADVLAGGRYEAVVLDTQVLGDEGTPAEALDAVLRAVGRTPLFVHGPEVDLDAEVAFLEAGAAAVLAGPPDPAGLRRVFARARARQAAQNARAWEDERYRLMVEHTFDIVAVLDGFGRYVYASPSVRDQLGFEPEALLGESAFETLHPDDLEHVAQVFMEAITQPGTTRRMEYRAYTAGGAVRHLEAVGRALVGPDGQAYGVINARDVTERHQAEEALRVRESRYRAISDSALDAIVIADEEGVVLDWNPAAERLFGYAPDEILGQPVARLMPARYREAHQAGMARFAVTGEARVIGSTVSMHGRRKDGTEFPLDLSLSTWSDEAGRYYTGLLRDVTERSAAVEALAASEARFRRLVEALPDVVSRIDADGRVLDFYVPETFTTETYPADVLGRRLQDTIPPELVARFDEAMDRLKATGEPVTYRYAVALEAGTMHREVRMIGLDGGEVFSLLRDVTREVEAEQALRAQEALLRQVVSSVPVIVFALDAEGRVLLIEGKGLDRIGVSPEVLLGQDPRLVFDGYPDVDAALARALRGEAFDRIVDLPGRSFEVYFAPVHDEHGALQRVIGVAADVTELREQRDALVASRAELRALAAHLHDVREEERARISREVHDVLGQQLTAIRLGVGWLDRRLVDDPEATRRADDTRALIDETIQHIRQVARELRPGILDDFGLASALEWHANDFAAQSGLTCTFEAGPLSRPVPPDVATACFRIVQEAMTNVARHADARRIDVSLREAEGGLWVSVQDDGVGIAPEPFRASQSLGLLGMRERARAVGGRVEIHGVAGEGTRVDVVVPFADDP